MHTDLDIVIMVKNNYDIDIISDTQIWFFLKINDDGDVNVKYK